MKRLKKRKEKILIVDDMPGNRTLLGEILSADCEILEAAEGRVALDLLERATPLPSIILLDIMMPSMDGFEVLEHLQANPDTAGIPVIFITGADLEDAENRGLRAGAIDYITKPFNPDVVKARVDNHLELKRYRNSLEKIVDEKARQLVRNKENMLEALATVIEYRNLESGHHVKRVSLLSQKLLLALTSEFSEQIGTLNASLLLKAVPTHDIGKIGISDAILLKPGPLTPEEFAVAQTHTTVGSDIIDTLLTHDASDEYLRHCRDICRHHHERFDGTGYPDGLKGEAIPLSARIVAIADVYDALVNSRIYKSSYSHEEAVQIILKGAGSQFDPAIVGLFQKLSPQFATLPLWGDRKKRRVSPFNRAGQGARP